MKQVFRKIGSVLFCLLPFLLAFALQFAISIPATIIKMVSVMVQDPGLLSDTDGALSTVAQIMEDGPFLAGVSALYALIAAAVMGFWYWKKFVHRKVPRRRVSQILNPFMLAGLVLLMIGMQYFATYIVTLIANISPSSYDYYASLLESIGFGDLSVTLVIYSVLIAPISEELIFRGVTMHYAVKCLPFFAANILQALLFGVFHGNLIQGAYAFVVGLFCGYVCYRGGSLYLSILFHMLFNLWGTFVPENVSYTGDSVLIHLLVFVGSLLVIAAGLRLYQKGIGNRFVLTSPNPEHSGSSGSE